MARERSVTIPGWHAGWEERLEAEGVRALKLSAEGFAGFMNCLYALRANSQPPAYQRAEATDQFQRAIQWVISGLEDNAGPHSLLEVSDPKTGALSYAEATQRGLHLREG